MLDTALCAENTVTARPTSLLCGSYIQNYIVYEKVVSAIEKKKTLREK